MCVCIPRYTHVCLYGCICVCGYGGRGRRSRPTGKAQREDEAECTERGVNNQHQVTRTYTPLCIHTYIHTYLHTYIPTYLHTYIHTYRHTCIQNTPCPLSLLPWTGWPGVPLAPPRGPSAHTCTRARTRRDLHRVAPRVRGSPRGRGRWWTDWPRTWGLICLVLGFGI